MDNNMKMRIIEVMHVTCSPGEYRTTLTYWDTAKAFLTMTQRIMIQKEGKDD